MPSASPLRAPPAPTAELSAEILTGLADLERIAAQWRRLEERASAPGFFQSYDWCTYVLRTRLIADIGASVSPSVVVVRRAGEPVLIWPLGITRTGGIELAQDLTEPFGQYSDALCAPDEDVNALLDVAWRALSRCRVDGLVLRKVRADAAIRPWLDQRARTIGAPFQAPAVTLSAFPTLAAYRATLTSKTRKNLRNYRNRLAREGDLQHEVVADRNARAALIEQCFFDRADWLEAGGLSSTAFSDPVFAEIVRGLQTGARGAPPALVMRLGLARADGSVDNISVQWGFEHRGRYYAFMAAKNPGYDAFSPGRLHLEDVVSACAARGIGTVDFLPPEMPYKSTWATESVDVSGFGLARTLKGRVGIDGWHGIVRPAVKRAFLATPPALRRMVMSAVR